MAASRVSLSLAGATGLASTVLAAATVWLLLTDPVAMVGAPQQGRVATLAMALAEVFSAALRQVLHWL